MYVEKWCVTWWNSLNGMSFVSIANSNNNNTNISSFFSSLSLTLCRRVIVLFLVCAHIFCHSILVVFCVRLLFFFATVTHFQSDLFFLSIPVWNVNKCILLMTVVKRIFLARKHSLLYQVNGKCFKYNHFSLFHLYLLANGEYQLTWTI